MKSGARSGDDVEPVAPKGSKGDRFRFIGMVQEDHRQPIFGVQFCYWFKSGCELLATAGSNRVSVYKCDGKPVNLTSNAPLPLHLLWAAHDENAAESYYSVAWGVINLEGKKEVILAVAGLLGVVRVLSAVGVAKNVFRGHGGAVNELLFHPHYPHILFSASKDHAIRIWDCQNALCLARLGGVAGHRDEVLTLDVILPSPSETAEECRFGRLVSGSLDHMICVWNLDAVLNDYQPSKPLKKPNLCHFPIFSTLDLHADYVDCCRYLPAVGVVASRAAKENCILLWRPCSPSQKGDVPVELMAQLEHRQSALWWLKFGVDASGLVLAAGTQQGRISVWRCNNSTQKIADHHLDLIRMESDAATSSNCSEGEDDDRRTTTGNRVPNLMTRFGEELRHPRCETAIRQVAVSRNGSRLVAVSEDARLWRWDIKPIHQANPSTAPASLSKKQSVKLALPAKSEATASKRPCRGRPPGKSGK